LALPGRDRRDVSRRLSRSGIAPSPRCRRLLPSPAARVAVAAPPQLDPTELDAASADLGLGGLGLGDDFGLGAAAADRAEEGGAARGGGGGGGDGEQRPLSLELDDELGLGELDLGLDLEVIQGAALTRLAPRLLQPS